MTYHATAERDGLVPGGYALRVIRRGMTGHGLQLKSMHWEPLADGQLSDCYLSEADTEGDMPEFLVAVMDAAWRAGFRPSSFGAEDKCYAAAIESQKAHIEDLKRQVASQNSIIEKLLGK